MSPVYDDEDDGNRDLHDKEYPDDADVPDEDDDGDPCPNCGREIFHDAAVCPHCGEMLSTTPAAMSKSPFVVIVILVLLGVMLAGWLMMML